jgi:hypothetical protein
MTEHTRNLGKINFTDGSIKSHVASKISKQHVEAVSEFYLQRDTS